MNTLTAYESFLKSKAPIAVAGGFDAPSPPHYSLLEKPHQADIAYWAIKQGQAAVFAAFGLGKTRIQLQLAKWVHQKTGRKFLIVAPLGVRQEFTRNDGPAMGMVVTYCRNDAEVAAADTPFIITNYERVRDGDIDVSRFGGVSLDEASCLRSYGTLTTQRFCEIFKAVPYRFLATATPCPNDYIEIINYAHFLGVMDRGQALTRWFQRDSKEAGNLQLYPHEEERFWLWVATWGVFVSSPADLGHDATGYDLPKMHVHWHVAKVDFSRAASEMDNRGQRRLIPKTSGGIQEVAKERRETYVERIAEAKRIIDQSPDDHWIIWHYLEDERHEIQRQIPEARAVYGSQPLEEREDRIVDFSNGKFRILSAKPQIAGSGCNFQKYCHKAIFVGPTDKFNDFIQAVHRIYRFLQVNEVEIHIVFADTQHETVAIMKRKWRQHDTLTAKMKRIVKANGLNKGVHERLKRMSGVERQEVAGKNFRAINNDCVVELKNFADDSIDQIVTSIPFCYDAATQVLTKRGWLSFGDVELSDSVATVNPYSLCMEWQTPTKKVWQQYDGEMLHFTGRSFDHMVTPNHKMFAARRGAGFSADKFSLVDAETVAKTYDSSKRKSTANGRVLRGWRTCLVPPKQGSGDCPEKISIPSLPATIRTGHGVELYFIETVDFMRLVGWYLTEGHADPFDSGRQGGRIAIGQTGVNRAFRDEIEDLFLRIGLPPNLGQNQLTVWCRNLAWFLQQEFGHGSADKRIPRWVKDFDPKLLAVLRDTMMKGDGTKNLMQYASISGRLRDDFQEICLLTGWRSSVSVNGDKKMPVGQTQLFPEIRKGPKRVQYSGMIGCLTVPNHTLIVRRNGQAFVSGNSDHYEYSPNYNDFGHNQGDEGFFKQFDFLVPELYRVTKPGRVACIHTKDRIEYGVMTGNSMYTVNEFSDKTVAAFKKHGWMYMGRIVIDTDVVRENAQTYRLGHSRNAEDATVMGCGSTEFVLLFRKWHPSMSPNNNSRGPHPVLKPKTEYSRGRWQIHASGVWRSSGDELISPAMLAGRSVDAIYAWWKQFCQGKGYDYPTHVQFCEAIDKAGKLPATMMLLAPHGHDPNVWTDVLRIKTLNTELKRKTMDSHVCLARGSLILTKQDGYKPIQDIEIGDLVLTHKGRWRPVIAKRMTGVNPVVKLNAQGVSGLVLTPTHKVWARDSQGVSHPKQKAMKAKPAWVESQSLAGCCVNQKLPPAEGNDGKLSPREWWLVGRWIADGHYTKRKQWVVSCGNDKREEFLAALGDNKGTEVIKCGCTQIVMKDLSSNMKAVLSRCGSGASAKRIPTEVFTGSDSTAMALLHGYLSGDGHFIQPRGKWAATTVSKPLALGLSMLIQKTYRVIPSVSPGKPSGTTVIEGRTVKTKQEWVVQFCPKYKKGGSFGFISDDGAWKKVKKVEPAGTAQTWNIRVEEDESYTAEGCVVKNCPLQLDVIERLIERYSNPGDAILDPFGGLMSTPYQAIQMGRKGVGIELNSVYWKYGVGFCQRIEADMATPTLFDFIDAQEANEVTA